jgi:sugar/nucleoside kinase (ribokinase family)
MKILVIGHSVEDHIHQNNEEEVKPGGIYYSVLGLSKIITADDEIHLVTALQKSNEHLFSDVYNKINKKNISWVDEIPKVHLIIHESEERTECYENVSQNLEVDYEILSGFDGILINMITGFDITLEQLKEIRKHFKGLIYFDVHTLSRGFNETKTRVFQQIENFSQWASSVDLIQANEYEVRTLFRLDSEAEIAAEILKYGTKYFIVTKGQLGAHAYYQRNDEIESIYSTAEKVGVNNKVGCGDIFGSVFFYNYLKTKNINESLTVANYAAGQSASIKNLNELNLKS